MNDRIKQLIDKCTEKSHTFDYRFGNRTETYFNKEKFAELILQECMRVSDYSLLKNMLPSDNIREHFGIQP